MKKQWFAIIYLFLLLFGGLLTAYESPTLAKGNGAFVIPDEAIRLRILANSDSKRDQQLKRKIRDEINEHVNEWVQHITSIEEARELIRNRIPEIEKIVQSVLEKENSQQSFAVRYSKVEFPTKLYGNYLYPAGYYEAILVTLGDGQGANWWCVLFPPLCFIDFSHSEAVTAQESDDNEVLEKQEEKVIQKLVKDEKKDKEEIEVKFFIVEWFTSLFS